MEPCEVFLCCVFKTIGKTSVFISQWCALQAFVQATMWHNTEPKTLGISYWSSGLFISAICLPGLVYSILSALIPTANPQKTIIKPCCVVSSFLARTMPALMLCIASSPLLDSNAEVRTGLLGVAVLSISIYVAIIPWALSEHCDNFSETSKPQTNCPDPEVKLSKRFNTRTTKVFCGWLSGCNVANDVVIAVCAVMGIRWIFGSINVFYEDLAGSLILTIIVILYSLVVSFWEQFSVRPGVFSTWPFKWKSSSGKNTKVPKDNSKELPDTRQDMSNHVHECGDTFLPRETQSGNDIGVDPRFSHIYDNTEDHKDALNHSRENNTIVSTVGDGISSKRNPCAPDCFAFIYAFILGLAIGASGYMFLWLFTSPFILLLWAELNDNPGGYVIYACFTLGCLLAVVLNIEQRTTDDVCTNNNEKSRTRRLRYLQYMFYVGVNVMMITGCGIILLYHGAMCLFGAALFSMASPILLRLILEMTYNLVVTTKHMRRVGKKRGINAIPAVILFLAGLTFSVFHFLGVMFINPQMTSIVHGRMWALLWPQVLLSITPIICGPFLKKKLEFTDRLRSSSTGPLLAPESPDMKKKQQNECSKVVSDLLPLIKREEWRKCRKITQIVLLLMFLIIFSLRKGVSEHSKQSYDVGNYDEISCDASNNFTGPALRVISWNVLLGHTMTGKSNLRDIAKITDQYEPHFLALQEASGHPPYWGGKDIFGYLKSSTRSNRMVGKVVNPKSGAFEVGILSKLKIINQSSIILPNEGQKKLPHYTMAKISCQILSNCSNSQEQGSGFEIYTSPRSYNDITLHIYTLHAVYKNWTCDRLSNLSCHQMGLILEDIGKLPPYEPVIVMGDFNINPSEPELDIWFQSGFKSALWPSSPNSSGRNFNYTCGKDPIWDDEKCDCECRNGSSDPPKTSLLNRKAAVDHILYRGLKLVERGRILDHVGNISDHYPVMADFVLQ